MNILTHDFYNRSPLAVATDLLGKILVHRLDTVTLAGRIVEVEAYLAFVDEAAHSFAGKTPRNTVLYGPAGHAYVHSIHQQHCLDVVTEAEAVPSSVLIRALEPLEGINTMQFTRGKDALTDLTSGPGKLTQAMQITKTYNGYDLASATSRLYIIEDGYVPKKILASKRIGITKAIDIELRFCIAGSPYLSKK